MLPPLALGYAPNALSDEPLDLEELVVTARKVAEDLYQVPMSIQLLSGNRVDTADLSTLYDIQFDVPGLVVASVGMFGAGIALRGVTNEGGSSLANAPHMNGVYLGQSTLALSRLFDVERVEILKGPQGTLMGRNSTGGSINIVTRMPEPIPSAAVEVAFGSFDTLRFRGHVNVSGDSAALRFAVAAADGDGYIRNSLDDRTFAEEDYLAVRGSLRIEASELLTLNVMAQRVHDDGASADLWLPNRGFLPDPGDIHLTTVTLANPHLKMTNDIASLDITFATDWATWHSISGYARNETSALDDCAGFPLLQGCVRGLDPSVHEQWSQEFRLESSAHASIRWLMGLNLFSADESTRFHTNVPGLGPRPVNDYLATSNQTAYAAFGQADYRLGERWRISGGVRVSREKTRVESSGTGTDDNPTPVLVDGEWDNQSWRVDLQFAPAPSAFVYASVATGFKSGGVTTEKLPDGGFDAYAPEELTAYEFGVKWRSADARATLLASAFAYDFRDLQVQTVAVLADRIVSVIDNAAEARIKGLDLSASMKVTEALTLSGGFVWLPERNFVDFADPVTGETLSGNRLSRAPAWAASASIELRIPVAEVGVMSARLDYNYRSGYFFTKENDPLAAQEAFGLLNLFLRLESSSGSWYVFATGRNLLDADHFNQAFIQSSPGYPDTYEVGVGVRF